MKTKFRFLMVCAVFGSLSVYSQTSSSTSSLSCWDKGRGGTFVTRHAKSPVSKASGGSAYAEVTAEASTDTGQAQFCKNKAQVFFSSNGTDYKVVYEKAGLEDQGVGIRMLGWSQAGTQLLMEQSVWGYDRDVDVVKSALAFDAATARIKELPLDDAFQRVFGKDCEFDSSLVGWQTNESILIRVSKTSATTRYQQTFCVDKPTIYTFNLREGKVQSGKP